jgi:hypothetical protein
MGFDIDISQVMKNLSSLGPKDLKKKAATKLYADTAAGKLEVQAKKEAPWTDQTSNARKSIRGRAYWTANNQIEIVLSGGMPYSPHLELAREKKYAILVPTVENNKEKILKTLSERLIK